MLHDTTELRRLENLRQEFAANVSHELKTPLSVIKVCVETLLDGAVEDTGHRDRFLEQISRQADRLHALILDLLSLARIESGAELFHFTSVPLQTLAEACIERHRPRAEARNQRLDIEIVRPGLHVWADEEAVDHILENLLATTPSSTPARAAPSTSDWAPKGHRDHRCRRFGHRHPVRPDLPRASSRAASTAWTRRARASWGGPAWGCRLSSTWSRRCTAAFARSSEPPRGTTFRVQLPLAARLSLSGGCGGRATTRVPPGFLLASDSIQYIQSGLGHGHAGRRLDP